jgi:hypothetical protein
MQVFKSALLTLLLMPLFSSVVVAQNNCTYTTYKWNVDLKKVVEFKTVSHAYSSLEKHEVDERTSCTVCEEDQVWIKIGSILPFRVCKVLEPKIRDVLSSAYYNGFTFNKVVGYRVGMTRGKVDEEGNRTQFSNHSFGIAIDINEGQNGLYDQCIQFSDKCRLRKGGRWQPEVEGALTKEGQVVIQMGERGFKWGGEIKGWQKDFMHFSPTGY